MKVAFFNPNISNFNSYSNDEINLVEDYVHPPLNLLALATFCSKSGFDCYVYDLSIYKHPELELDRIITKCQPDIACFSVITATLKNALKYANSCKRYGMKVIFGGHAATFCYNEIMNSNSVDAVICGEGENSLRDLLKSYSKNETTFKYPNTIVNNKKYIIFQDHRISNLDDLPMVDFDLVDMKPYIEKEALGMITSRGCNYNCHFCSCQKMWKRRITYESLSRTLSTIDTIVMKYNYSQKWVTFFDDTFTSNKNRIKEFCLKLMEKKYDIIWKVMTRCDLVNRELIDLMYESGCRQITFGIEGTTNNDLNLINKGFSIDVAKKAIEICNNKKLITEGYFIIGFPWQKSEDIFTSVENISSFELTIPRLSYFTPYPGTQFATNIDKFCYKVPFEDTNRYTNNHPIVETDNFGLEDQAVAMASFIDKYVINYRSKLKHTSSLTPSQKPIEGKPFFEEMIDSDLLLNQKFDSDFKISPHLIYYPIKRDTLVYDFYNGNMIVLNKMALDILKTSNDNHNIESIVQVLQKKYNTILPDDIFQIINKLKMIGIVQ